MAVCPATHDERPDLRPGASRLSGGAISAMRHGSRLPPRICSVPLHQERLAQVVNRTAPESLLDTYHAERHPVGARVLRNTMASVALRQPDGRTKALRETIAELLSMDEPRRRLAAEMATAIRRGV
jgi:hypothetical protein